MDKAGTKVIGASHNFQCKSWEDLVTILYFTMNTHCFFSCRYISCPFTLAKSIRCTLFSSWVCNLEFWGHFTSCFCFLTYFAYSTSSLKLLSLGNNNKKNMHKHFQSPLQQVSILSPGGTTFQCVAQNAVESLSGDCPSLQWIKCVEGILHSEEPLGSQLLFHCVIERFVLMLWHLSPCSCWESCGHRGRANSPCSGSAWMNIHVYWLIRLLKLYFPYHVVYRLKGLAALNTVLQATKVHKIIWLIKYELFVAWTQCSKLNQIHSYVLWPCSRYTVWEAAIILTSSVAS